MFIESYRDMIIKFVNMSTYSLLFIVLLCSAVVFVLALDEYDQTH